MDTKTFLKNLKSSFYDEKKTRKDLTLKDYKKSLDEHQIFYKLMGFHRSSNFYYAENNTSCFYQNLVKDSVLAMLDANPNFKLKDPRSSIIPIGCDKSALFAYHHYIHNFEIQDGYLVSATMSFANVLPSALDKELLNLLGYDFKVIEGKEKDFDAYVKYANQFWKRDLKVNLSINTN